MSTCFISYSWDSVEQKAWVVRLARSLSTIDEVKIIYDQDRVQNPIANDIPSFIRDAIVKADFIVVVATPLYVAKANDTLGYIGQETTLIRSRIAKGFDGVRPVLRSGDCLPAYLEGKHYADMRNDASFAGAVTDLLFSMGALGKGIALRDAVFDGQIPLPGKVFAIELLRSPVWLHRKGRQKTVAISRSGVELGLYMDPGRRRIVELTFSDSADLEDAHRRDIEIHKFLLGSSAASSFPIDQPNLRWASGGVLSQVFYEGRTWFSFFFRDIPPYGWNISLGASETEHELADPWAFLMREFFEETLVCRPGDGLEMIRRPVVFDRLKIDEEIQRAENLSKKHRDLRFARDGMQFRDLPGAPVIARLRGTETEICIDGNPPVPDVLVCISLSELGIEVLKVVRYGLGEGDVLLDGEIYEPAGSDQVELVRMPVALISEDYLSEAFSGVEFFKYTSPFDAPMQSVEGPPIPENEIRIFTPDVIRRVEIARDPNARATKWEQEHFTKWFNRFGGNFVDKEYRPTNANASPLFTPTSAKAIAYFFANR